MFKIALVAFGGLALAGCAASPATPAQSPQAQNEPAPAATTATGKAPPKAEPPPPAKVPDPPAACAEFVKRAPSNCAKGDSRELLAAALAESVVSSRDEKLVCLESEPKFAPGVIRALRADLAPEACADAIVAPVVSGTTKLDSETEHALLGLALAAKLSRLAADPPSLKPPFDKQKFMSFFDQELKPWVLSQAAAIGELSTQGSRLNGAYGKAVAAVAAGTADLRFVDLVREIPLPDEMKNDKEVRDVYYATLDEALDPRKTRGRDAALVGLRLFAQLGSLQDPRIDRARSLLAKLYSGARVDALDQLLLPPLPPVKLDRTERKLAAGLPTYYTLVLLADLDPTDKDTLRALVERGLPPPVRKKLDEGKLSPESTRLYARALLASGQRYFRAADFRRAAELVAKQTDDESKLISGVARALEAGPADAADLMLKGPRNTGMGSVSELEALAKGKSKQAGMATFDAAYVLELVPRRDDPTFWQDLSARYESAAKLLADPAHKKRAGEYSAAAKSTAAALAPKQ